MTIFNRWGLYIFIGRDPFTRVFGIEIYTGTRPATAKRYAWPKKY